MNTYFKTISFLGFFLILISIYSCLSSRERFLKKQYKEIYIEEFKMTYFDAILRAAFNNSKEINDVINSDNHHYPESILSLEERQLIDSFARIHNKLLVTDSLNRIGRVAEGGEGKHVWYFVLEKMQGHWLDSLARKQYKSSSFNHLYKDQ